MAVKREIRGGDAGLLVRRRFSLGGGGGGGFGVWIVLWCCCIGTVMSHEAMKYPPGVPPKRVGKKVPTHFWKVRSNKTSTDIIHW
jgi:hypothetical protein